MRHPPARTDGRGHLNPAEAESGSGGARSWLLIGNSRWHWAETAETGLCIRHCSAPPGSPSPPPFAWAAVGAVPPGVALPSARRLRTETVPLGDLPPWLGVDRALAGWMAWSQRRRPVLVADAGTVLSLTCVDRDGCFRGGRLIAGMGLQLRAMAAGTAALPGPPAPSEIAALLDGAGWPRRTEAAMAVGVAQGLAAALAEGFRQLNRTADDWRLVLTGGDAATLLPLTQSLLAGDAPPPELEEDLALRALVALRPAGEPQARPRSLSS